MIGRVLRSLHGPELALALVLAIASFVVSAIVVSYVLCRLPSNLLRQEGDPPSNSSPFVRIAGALLMVVGAVLMVPGVPGHGLLTILAGALLLDLPPARRLAKRLLRHAGVRTQVNRIRTKRGIEPIEGPGKDPPSDVEGGPLVG